MNTKSNNPIIQNNDEFRIRQCQGFIHRKGRQTKGGSSGTLKKLGQSELLPQKLCILKLEKIEALIYKRETNKEVDADMEAENQDIKIMTNDCLPNLKRQSHSGELSESFNLPRSKTDPVSGVYIPPQLNEEQLLQLPGFYGKRLMDPILPFEKAFNLRKLAGGKSTKCVEQICLDTGRVLRRYISGVDASVAMQVSQSGISLCCSGIKPDAYGFKWRICDDPHGSDAAAYIETPIEILLDMRVMKGKNQYTINSERAREKKKRRIIKNKVDKGQKEKNIEAEMIEKKKDLGDRNDKVSQNATTTDSRLEVRKLVEVEPTISKQGEEAIAGAENRNQTGEITKPFTISNKITCGIDVISTFIYWR